MRVLVTYASRHGATRGIAERIAQTLEQHGLAAGIPNARLRIIERAGHNPHDEETAEVMAAIRDFIATGAAVSAASVGAA